jgi:hypothetical protein
MKSFLKCHDNIISNNMHEFKQKKLKLKNNKIVENPKQAIAISLNQIQKKCQYNSEEIKELYKKVNSDLNDKDKEINLTNIIELKNIIKYLFLNNKIKKINNLKNLLWNKIINLYNHDLFLNKNIWNELNKIEKIILNK